MPGELSLTIETVTVGDLPLGAQGWYGMSEPRREKFSPPARTGGPEMKPKDGFFTSTIEQGTTPWVDVVRRTLRNHEPRSLWEMTPDPQARLAIIDSVEDYRHFGNERGVAVVDSKQAPLAELKCVPPIGDRG